MLDHVFETDPEIAKIIVKETARQHGNLEMIASENFVSMAVLEAAGSTLTNKYAEGYPGKRYYGGCVHVDEAETLAIQRACALFGAAWANVQPHSGSQANMSVFFTLLEPGDTMLTMDLSHGGHLTHGAKVNFSGRLYTVVHYHVRRETGLIDFDEVRDLARKHRPKLILAGGSAYPRRVDAKTFRQIADEVGAILMVDMAHFAGLVAAKLHPDPVAHAHVVTTTTHKTLRGPRGGMVVSVDAELGKKIDKTIFPGMQGGPLCHIVAAKAVSFAEALRPEFADYEKRILENAKALAEGLTASGISLFTGGTDTHLMLADLNPHGTSGKVVEEALDDVGITVNKNAIPFDTRKPLDPGGIRIGTPALTTRGMGPAEMKQISAWIAAVIKNPGDANTRARVRDSVRGMCERFPLYPEILERSGRKI